MICGKCQVQCLDTARFCSECGQDLQLQRINAAPMAFGASNGAGLISRVRFGHIVALFLLLAFIVGAGRWAWQQTQERQTRPISRTSGAGNLDSSLDKGEEIVQPSGKKTVESVTNSTAPSSSITPADIMQPNSSATTMIKTPLQSQPNAASKPVQITISAALASEVGIVRGFPPTGNPPASQASVTPATATAAAGMTASAVAKRTGWYEQFKTELSACNGNFFEREFCKQRVSWRHCQPNNAWGKVPECVENKTESHTR